MIKTSSANQRYSWRGAPQQSPLLLLSDDAKLRQKPLSASNRPKLITQKDEHAAKKKRTKKRNQRNGLRP
jgi:hypothetical protein